MTVRSPTWRAEALAFVTAFVTLFAQILVHRMASLKLLNNLAFLVISLTMLGFALSGVLLSRWLTECLERRNDVLVGNAALFALTLVAAAALFYRAGGPSGPLSALGEMPYWMLVSLLFALPFAFCGLSLGLLLSSPDLPTRRVYGADLAGSALGAFAVIPAIARIGVEESSLLAGAALLCATWALAPARLGRTRALAAVAVVALAFAAWRPDEAFQLHYRKGSMLASSGDPASGVQLEYTVWDPLTRVEVSRIPPPDPARLPFPALVGQNRSFLSRFRRMLTQ